MKRREFISLLGGAAAWPLAARAQQGRRMRRVGALMPYAANDPHAQARNAAFLQGLQQLGWTVGTMAAAWSIAAYAQESATMPATSGTTASLPQIELARVKPVDQMPPNVRLSDDLIDLMKAFSLSSAEGIGRAWGAPLRPPTPFDERFGQWETRLWPQ
jgi:hypothetical protein